MPKHNDITSSSFCFALNIFNPGINIIVVSMSNKHFILSDLQLFFPWQ